MWHEIASMTKEASHKYNEKNSLLSITTNGIWGVM